jgi:hypothetical protein
MFISFVDSIYDPLQSGFSTIDELKNNIDLCMQ